MAETENQTDVAALTVQLLSAYLANNSVASEHLASLIRTTRAALIEDTTPLAAEAEAPTYTPAVSVRKSLASSDHLISLIDGKPYKTLKRHLSANGLTPDQYRERYGLPANYPMVAPSFTARRREIAERIGLGSRRSVDAVPAAQTVETPESISVGAIDDAPAKRPRGRPAGKQASAKSTTAAAGTANAPGRKPKGSADAGASGAVTKADPVAVVDEPNAAIEAEAAPAEAAPARAKNPKLSTAKSTTTVGKRTAKKVAAKPSTATAAKAAEAVTNPVSQEEAPAPAPKRRGKLGLFGKPAGQVEEHPSEAGVDISKDTDVTDGASDAAEADEAATKKPAGKKRMARAAKLTPSNATADEAAGE